MAIANFYQLVPLSPNPSPQTALAAMENQPLYIKGYNDERAILWKQDEVLYGIAGNASIETLENLTHQVVPIGA